MLMSPQLLRCEFRQPNLLGIKMTKQELDLKFEEFYDQYHRMVLISLLRKMGNNWHDAEDLTAQTFLQAYRHFERALAEQNGRPIEKWLLSIAFNLMSNFYRNQARKIQTDIDEAIQLRVAHSTEDMVEGRDELKRTFTAMQDLSDDRRQAIVLSAAGMSVQQIADRLDRKPGAAKALVCRARAQLQQLSLAA